MMAAIVDVAALSARISGKTVWTFVRACDAEGRCGWGEATLQGQAAEIHRHVEALAPKVIARASRPRMDVADIVGTRGRSAPESAAIGGIDQALLDLSAQARGVPLAALLGTPRRSTIDLYANINRGTVDRSPAGFAARAREAADSGFKAIKIAPLDDLRPGDADSAAGRRLLDAGIARVAAVRAALGSQAQLLVDCHWRLDEASASTLIHALEPHSLYWIECPLREDATTLPALRRLRSQANRIGVRLAGCESMTGVEGFRPFLEAGAYDVIMPDVKYAGGLIEMLRIAEAAATHDVLCSPHNPSGPIAHAHSVHVSALLASFPFLEFQFGESPLFAEIIDASFPQPENGSSALPTTAGSGASIDMARVQPLLMTLSAGEASGGENAAQGVP